MGRDLTDGATYRPFCARYEQWFIDEFLTPRLPRPVSQPLPLTNSNVHLGRDWGGELKWLLELDAGN
jgi:hypothetical protein